MVIATARSAGGLACAPDDDKGFAEGANIRRQAALLSQRVEDNAFHLGTFSRRTLGSQCAKIWGAQAASL
jgi:hypothetical protein